MGFNSGFKGLMSPHLIFSRVRHIVFTDSRKIKVKYCEGLQWRNVLRKKNCVFSNFKRGTTKERSTHKRLI